MEIEEAKRRSKRGPIMLLFRRIFAVGITFISTVTVARLLSPKDYGVANMSFIMLNFAQIFQDFGLTNAVLRKGSISQQEMSIIFWFNAIVTMAISILLIGFAPSISAFYNEPQLRSIMLVSIIGFAFNGLTLQHRSLMNRELNFSTIALVDVLSILIGFFVTLTLAIILRNAWAIVWGFVAQSVSVSLLILGFNRWVPSRPVWSNEVVPLLKFGANTSLYSISIFVSGNIAPILIGHFIGASALGQFSRAQVLFGLPNANLIQPITQATMPLLTHLRPFPDDYREAYIALVRKLCTFLLGAAVVLAFIALPLVQALLGAKWSEAGYVLTALSPALAVTGLGYCAGDLFVTQDRSGELRNLGLIELIVRVAAVAYGVSIGLIGAAIGFSLSTILVVWLRVYVAGSKGPVSMMDHFRAALPGLPIALGALIGCLGSSWIARALDLSALLQTVMIGVGAVATAAIFGLSVSSSRAAMGELLGTFALKKRQV
jgi:PST family polysaccharide transporter